VYVQHNEVDGIAMVNGGWCDPPRLWQDRSNYLAKRSFLVLIDVGPASVPSPVHVSRFYICSSLEFDLLDRTLCLFVPLAG